MRSQLIAQRLALSPEEVIHKTDDILKKLRLSQLIQGLHVALYLSHRQEVMAERLLPWLLEQGLFCYLPVLMPDSRHLTFARYEKDTPLAPNRYGILEPMTFEPFEPRHLDTVIVPLVAFNTQCERMGTGEGYYDTTFAFLNQTPRPMHPRLIGLAYDFQARPLLTQHDHDIRLNNVVTETQVYGTLPA